MTLQAQLAIVVGVLGGCQAWALAEFRALLAREAAAGEPAASLPAVVVVPCKGAAPGLAENARALLAQDHPSFELLFVVPSREDGAYAVLEEALAGDERARLVTGGAAPARCSGKIADVLQALRDAPARARVFAFADADMRVRPDWLRRLAAPLEDGSAAVATSCMLYVPPGAGLWGFLRLLWMAAGAPYLARLGVVAGHSFALTRREFEALGVAELWSRSLMEDLALAARARERGRPVLFLSAAMPVAVEGCGAGEYFALAVKWLTCFKVYDKRVWAPAALACAAHAWVVWIVARRPAHLGALLLLWLVDGGLLAALVAVLRRRLPDRFEALSAAWRPPELWAFLLAPLLWATYALQVAASAWPRDIRWGGRVYRLRGPQDVEVVG